MGKGVCASKSLQLDSLLLQCRGTMQDAVWGSKIQVKVGGRRYFEKAAVIYCTINSPGTAGLAQTRWQQHSNLGHEAPR